MRPDPWQLYRNPDTFIAALEAAGVSMASVKVNCLLDKMVEAKLFRTRIIGTEADRTRLHQSQNLNPKETHRRRNPGYYRREKLNIVKRISTLDRVLILYRSNLKKILSEVERKIAKWPDLEVDPETLTNRINYGADSIYAKRRLRRRRHKSLLRHFI